LATAVWSGTITFGLVSIPVKLFAATTSHNVSFNLLHRECKNRINLQNYCAHCEKVVERSDLVKGYQYEKNQYVLIEDEDMDSVQPESSSNLEITQFINVNDVDPIYFERTYYLGPDKGSEKTFALLSTAMQETTRAALGKLVMRNHEYLALIRPGMDGLLVHFMLYADEIRENENKVGKDIEIRPKEVQLAKQLIENLSEPFEPDKFHDEYVSKLEEMIEAKIKGRKLTVVTPKARPKVVDLMDALQKSVQQTKRPVARAGNEQRSTRLKKVK
jgi:DNA end-binding protein Ku